MKKLPEYLLIQLRLIGKLFHRYLWKMVEKEE